MIETERELLCFPGPGGVYAVGFEFVEEICIDVNLRPVPRLPDYICGVFYHKGTMIPVVQMENETQKDGFSSVLVVKCVKGLLGIRISGSPWVSSFAETAEAFGEYRELAPKRWEVKKAYRQEDTLVFLLDMDKSAEKLTAFNN